MPMSLQNPAAPACINCYSRKGKCDRRRPGCSYCSRKGISCVYPGPNTADRPQRQRSQPYRMPTTANVAAQSPVATVPPRETAATFPVIPGPTISSTFPAVFYLDRDVFQGCKVEIPEPNKTIPPDVLGFISKQSDWVSTAEKYFSSAHSWMPIISKKRFFEKIHVNSELHADYALLILCMELINRAPEGENPRTPAYVAAKHFYLDLEIAGCKTLQILQAGILIALYEFGHAIFPSAAVSIEACVRYGYDLGINWNSTHSAKKPFAWVDAEEQNRVWWAIVILDRIRGIGSPDISFLTEDPPSSVPLPADESAWDEGIMPLERLSDLPPSSIDDLGRFSLTAEATKLLGRVFQHVKADEFHDEAHNEEARLLDCALRALDNAVQIEGYDRMLDIMNQAAMCSIALLVLHEAHTLKQTRMAESFNHAHHVQEIADLVARAGEVNPDSSNQRPIDSCVKEASPLLTSLLYQVAVAILRIKRKEGSQESLERLTTMKTALREFNQRWRAAGAYLDILEAREISQLL